MRATILTVGAVVLGATFATSARAQQDAQAAAAGATAGLDGGDPDRGQGRGRLARPRALHRSPRRGVLRDLADPDRHRPHRAGAPTGFRRLTGNALDAGTVTAPIIGVRYWLQRSLGIDAGIGIGYTGGSTTVNNGTTSTTTSTPSQFGFALHGGVPIAFAEGHHYVFELVPETTFGFASGSVKGAPGGGQRWRRAGHEPQRAPVRPRRADRRGAPLRLHRRTGARAPGFDRLVRPLPVGQRKHREQLGLDELHELRDQRRERPVGNLRQQHLRALLFLSHERTASAGRACRRPSRLAGLVAMGLASACSSGDGAGPILGPAPIVRAAAGRHRRRSLGDEARARPVGQRGVRARRRRRVRAGGRRRVRAGRAGAGAAGRGRALAAARSTVPPSRARGAAPRRSRSAR